jgi:hypothetical protein
MGWLDWLWASAGPAWRWLSANPERLLGSALTLWVLSQLAAALTQRSQHRRRLRHAAVALRTEIEINREGLEAFIPGFWAMADSLIQDPTRRFFVLANRRSQQTLEGLQEDLIFMPGQVLKAVIEFYSLDSRINQFVESLTQPLFLDRPAEKQVEILWVYADLFEDAVASARRAEKELKLLAWRNASRLSHRPYLFWFMLWRYRRQEHLARSAPERSTLVRR